MSLDGPDEEGHCNSWSVTGTSQLRLASVLQSSPSKSWPSDGQNVPSASTYTSRRGKGPDRKCTRVRSVRRSFTVLSNAKRHLKTHGIDRSTRDISSSSAYNTGFEQPVVDDDVHDPGMQPSRDRWVTQNTIQRDEISFFPLSPSNSLPLSLALPFTDDVYPQSAVAQGSDRLPA